MSIEQRELTVKRAITRVKTITAEISDIIKTIENYGAVPNNTKCKLGLTAKDGVEVTPAQTIAEAKKVMESKKQQLRDLITEKEKLQLAIAKSNLNTKITVRGKEMTVYEALMFKSTWLDMYNKIEGAIVSSLSRAETHVDMYNRTAQVDPSTGKKFEAQVVSFFSNDEIEAYGIYDKQFMVELNGELDDSNATTKIIIE